MPERETTHPGEVLREQFMIPRGISEHRLARDLDMTWSEVDDLIHGRRRMDPDTALRLARYFGNSLRFWLRASPQSSATSAGRA